MNKNRFQKFDKKEIETTKLKAKVATLFFYIIFLAVLFLFLVGYILTKAGVDVMANRWIFLISAIWGVAMICVALSYIACFLLIKKVFKPLEELSEASLKVADGDFETKVNYDGSLIEIRNTIDSFNRMTKELGSVEIMRNNFVADVSHEFKTPLAAITGYVTFLQDEELSEKEREECIKKIFFNVDKLNELTENILCLSKLEHRQFLDEPITYRLDEQIREAIVLLEPKWDEKKITFDLFMPEMEYTGQKSLLFQVWVNIIGNAIKYSNENGNIQVDLTEGLVYYEISVKDEGIGMTEEAIPHIFDKFYQADTSRKAQGNGLGLAICKEIINKCNGNIIVESTYGVGTQVIVRLPKEGFFPT